LHCSPPALPDALPIYAGALVRSNRFCGRAELHVRKLRTPHSADGHCPDTRLLAVQTVPDRREIAASVPVRGIQSTEYAEFRGSRSEEHTSELQSRVDL